MSVESEAPEKDAKPAVKKKHARSQNANCISRLFFLWVSPLVSYSLKTVIEDDDIYDIPLSSEVNGLVCSFDKHWNPQGVDAKKLVAGQHLFQVGKELFLGPYAIAGLLMFLQNIVAMATPFLLKAFVDWFTNGSRDAWEGWVIGGSMVFLQMLGNQIIGNHAVLKLYVVGMNCRSLVNALVYRKALRLSQKARSQTTVGQVVSLMSSDSERLPMAVLGLNSLWISPITIVYGLVSLLWLIGWAGLVAVVIMIITLPVPMRIGAYQGKVMMMQMGRTDTRVKTVNEGLQGMRVLKYYTWDKPFSEKVHDCRNKEITELRKLSWAGAFAQSLMSVLPLLMGLAMIMTYYALDPDNFTPANAFTSLSLLNLIRMPLAMLPMGIKGYVDLKSTVVRLQRYLLLDEHVFEDFVPSVSGDSEKRGSVEVKCGSFQWEVGAPVQLSGKGKGKGKGKSKSIGDDVKGAQAKAGNSIDTKPVADTIAFTLSDVSIVGQAGQLCAIVGKVGSGKSSLLSVMLSEMPKRSGEVQVTGSIAYCSQIPWIQNATLRDNILFGNPMDDKRYDEVIHMCALGPDCNALPGGDLTEIGEKGVTLSGGQKARVALARACYCQADVYLLDDVLSAVDAETGSWLYEQCIKKLLARKCLVILATNAMNILEYVDVVWLLKEGVIVEQGTFEELRGRKEGALNEILSLIATESAIEVSNVAAQPETAPAQAQASNISQVGKKQWTVSSAQAGDANIGKLTAKELRAEGSVSWKVWYFYFVTCPGGCRFPFLVLLCAIMGQGSKNTFEWWLSFWTTESMVGDDKDHYIFVYAMLGAAAVTFQLIRALVLAEMILRNGQRMHELLLKSVMRAPMVFFETTSMGRIINRFSKDMDSMDTQLQRSMPTFMVLFTDIVGFALTIGINMPLFFTVLAPLMVVYWDVSRRFRPLNRDLQRLESTSRSPIFAQFSETLQGTSTIRAYGVAKRFLDQSFCKINTSNRAFFTIHNANRWLQLRLEFIGSLFLAAVICFAIEGRSSGNVKPGTVALSLFYASNATQILNFAIRMFAETEARMTSAERIHEYVTQICSEASVVSSTKLPSIWPSRGSLHLRDVSMRYRPNLPLVLNEISLNIEGGSKVGICGRTGSGKSTLFSVLFRIVDIYASSNDCSGRIHIDGVDVGELGLSDLRRALAIIPQDAVMFAGTLRENLDMFCERSDEQLWDALRHASMDNRIKQMPDGLQSLVQEGGENFSCGERQLVCLARALLRQSKIICLDEATANIDVKTDATIQEVIRTKFVDCTVLTIAHRLNTLANHDQILVLDAGRVAEVGSPAELLAMGKDGKFWSLVQDLGENAAAALSNEIMEKASSSQIVDDVTRVVSKASI